MRVILKGGVWKNTEDEILKAAVMKYGKNQWTRIASLLNRKSAKQCKARWYEWLDPSIKKTEWTKEEDEKLLHLAKLMPTQWRTIAPIVGRTPMQCLERYQNLLDQAELREAGVVSGDVDGTGAIATPTADEIRKLRPGEIDPHLETKPAKPDPVDMDEDEMEMLSEARARLANTQGKKAKRKARERQLEEARRLAATQKRQELKAAGIDYRYRRRRGEFDYNSEIPFEINAPAGFYDTREEKDASAPKSIVGLSVKDLEPKTRSEQEDENRKKDAEKKKKQMEQGIFKVPNLTKLDEEQRIAKRRKLNLPVPQIRDGELEELVKIGQSSDIIRATVDETEDAPSRGLISDYKSRLSTRISENVASTPARTPLAIDSVQAEATNLLRQQNIQTPLLGGENFEVVQGGTGFSGVTPQRVELQTPNVVASSFTPRVHGSERASMRGSSTGPAGSVTGSATPSIPQTPLRDDLRINEVETNQWDAGNDEDASVGAEDNYAITLEMQRRQLDAAFAALPEPKNDYEIVIPEIDEEEGDDEDLLDGDAEYSTKMEKDMSELEEEAIRKQQELERIRLGQRSLPVQKNLPVPNSLAALAAYNEIEQEEYDIDEADIKQARQFIMEEFVKLVERDVNHSSKKVETLDEQVMIAARKELEKECCNIEKQVIKFPRDYSSYVITKNGDKFEYIKSNQLNERQALIGEFELGKQICDQISEKIESIKSPLTDSLGQYIENSHVLAKRLKSAYDRLISTRIELESFKQLQLVETQIIIPERLRKMELELKRISDLEMAEQIRFKELKDRLNSYAIEV